MSTRWCSDERKPAQCRLVHMTPFMYEIGRSMWYSAENVARSRSSDDVSSLSSLQRDMNRSNRRPNNKRVIPSTGSNSNLLNVQSTKSDAPRSKGSDLSSTGNSGDYCELDDLLANQTNGLEIAFNRAKLWSKYCKEIINYIQRRINADSEHARQVLKMAESMRALLGDMNYLPLQDVFVENLKNEIEFATQSDETLKNLTEFKCVKRLERVKNEQDKVRKKLREQWDFKQKEYHDAILEHRKAKQAYTAREQQYKKAQEASMKVENRIESTKNLGVIISSDNRIDKKRRNEEEAMLKREHASENCRILASRVAEKKADLLRTRLQIITELRESIQQADQSTKACAGHYFAAMHSLSSLLPHQFDELAKKARTYQPGCEYEQFVRQYSASQGREPADEDITDLSSSTNQGTSVPIARRQVTSRPENGGLSPSTYQDDDDYADLPNITKDRGAHFSDASPAAQTHCLMRRTAPAKCGHCDAFAFFNIVTCSECLMSWHKTCLQDVDIACGPSARNLAALPRRMSIFGAPLTQQLDANPIPLIIRRCVSELDRRGLNHKGLYRISGVKSKIEQVCNDFEMGRLPDLSKETPTNIASILKLYLRQLPEPLLAHRVYDDLVALANAGTGKQESMKQLDDRMRSIISKLPLANQETLKYLLLHWRRILWFIDDNLMSASNLGLCLAPSLAVGDTTISVTSGSDDSHPLKALYNAHLLAKAIELFIDRTYVLYSIDEMPEWRQFVKQFGDEYDLDESDMPQLRQRNNDIDDDEDPYETLVENQTPLLVRKNNVIKDSNRRHSRPTAIHESTTQIDIVDDNESSSSHESNTSNWLQEARQRTTPDLLKTSQLAALPTLSTCSTDIDGHSMKEGTNTSTGDELEPRPSPSSIVEEPLVSKPMRGARPGSLCVANQSSAPNPNDSASRQCHTSTCIVVSPLSTRRELILPGRQVTESKSSLDLREQKPAQCGSTHSTPKAVYRNLNHYQRASVDEAPTQSWSQSPLGEERKRIGLVFSHDPNDSSYI